MNVSALCFVCSKKGEMCDIAVYHTASIILIELGPDNDDAQPAIVYFYLHRHMYKEGRCDGK